MAPDVEVSFVDMREFEEIALSVWRLGLPSQLLLPLSPV